LIVWLASGSAVAQNDPAARLSASVASAPQVVIGTVTAARARFETNRAGDELIVSRLTVRVSETLRGQRLGTFDVDVEGGTIGNLTLTVSDLTEMHEGDSAVFLLAHEPSGYVLHARGLMKLGSSGRLEHQPLTLDQIRAISAQH
jgi:hypothetical protein